MKKIFSLLLLNIFVWMSVWFFWMNSAFATTPPVISAPSAISIDENTTSVVTVTASDADMPAQNLDFYISQIFWFWWADDWEFVVDQATWELSFFSAPDFENPTQSWTTPNEYEVIVWVDDGTGNYDEVTITVTVLDVDENITTPVITSHNNGDVLSNPTLILEWTWTPWATMIIETTNWSSVWFWDPVDSEWEFSFNLTLQEWSNDLYVYSQNDDWYDSEGVLITLIVDTWSDLIEILNVVSHEDGDSVNNTNVVLEWIWSPNSLFELTNFTTWDDIVWYSTDEHWNFSVELALVEWLNEMYMYTLDDNYQNNGELLFELFVDTEAPIITYGDDVSETPVYEDVVNITYIDNNSFEDSQWGTQIQFYALIDDSTCTQQTYENATWLFSSVYSEDDIIFDTEDDNWKYICLKVEDVAWNVTYKSSAYPLNIDRTLPSPFDIIITSPSENEVVWTTTPMIIWTAFPDESVDILDWNYNILAEDVDVDENWLFSATLTEELPDGEHSIVIIPSYYLEWEDTKVNFVVDTTPAVISVVWETSLTIEYWQDYADEWAEYLDTLDWEWTITWQWDVDTSTIWEYEITYNYTDTAWNISEEVMRTVSVVDTTTPVITVVWENIIDTEFGEEYIDAWAEYSDNVDWTGSVDWVWEVDVNTLWGYTLTYDYTDTSWNISSTVSRLVNVVDTTAAIITITWESSIEIEYGENYSDEWAEYSDSVDGTSSLVWEWSVDTSTLWEYEITYNFTDEAWNISEEVVRTVTVVDTTNPILTLVWNESITVSQWSTYSDAWATYSDDVDWNGSVVWVHAVDTSTVWEYKVTYNYTDTAWNIAEEIERTVTVAVVTRSRWGGGGWSYRSTCKIETHLECKQNISWVYVYFKKSGVSCRSGSLWKACDASTAVIESDVATDSSELSVSIKTQLEIQEAIVLKTVKGPKYKTMFEKITTRLSAKNREIVIGRINKIDLTNEKYAKYVDILIYLRLMLEESLLED